MIATGLNPEAITNHLKCLLATVILMLVGFVEAKSLAEAIPVTGRWRGFNNPGMYVLEWNNRGFDEAWFQAVHEFGFNYARFPLDYRTYTKEGDWLSFDEEKLKQLDQALRWAAKYGIHVSLNLHRAPGFCIHDWNGPASWAHIPENQQLNLWKDKEAEKAFLAHWQMFAKRYQNISNEYLSFNLINEPGSDVSLKDYVQLMRKTLQVIRKITPDRTIIVDGTGAGENLPDELLNLGVMLSKHSYEPKNICNYKAPWDPSSQNLPVPIWPPAVYLGGYLYGDYKDADDLHHPLVVRGDFVKGAKVTMHVNQASIKVDFQIKADDQVLFRKFFEPKAGQGEWKTVKAMNNGEYYQNIYDQDYSATLTQPATQVSFGIEEGDWLTFTRIVFEPPTESRADPVTLEPSITDWGVSPAILGLTPSGGLTLIEVPAKFEKYYRLNDHLDAWRAAARKGAKIVVGEFGVYKNTPHDVTLGLTEFKLKAFQEAGFGWCMWDFIGDLGILDSGRKDVTYEDYKGHQLDRKYLELLQKY